MRKETEVIEGMIDYLTRQYSNCMEIQEGNRKIVDTANREMEEELYRKRDEDSGKKMIYKHGDAVM